MAGNGVVHQRAAATVGHVGDVELGAARQERHRQVAQTARADAAVAHVFAGLCRRHDIGKSLVGRVSMRGQHHGARAHQGHCSEVALRVKRHARDERWIHGVGVKHHGEGVAVRRAIGYRARTDGARRAAPVVDDHRLPQALLQGRTDDAGDLIDRAAGGEHRHQLDGLFGGPGLGCCDRGAEHGQQGQERCKACGHGVPLCGFVLGCGVERRLRVSAIHAPGRLRRNARQRLSKRGRLNMGFTLGSRRGAVWHLEAAAYNC